MSHLEDKKATKRGNKKSKKPEVISADETKKNSTQGVIKGT